MSKPPMRRSGGSGREAAEAAFKSVTAKPVEPSPGPKPSPVLPGAREMVTLRIDCDVLEYFQADGAGWQDRINEALRRAVGK